MNENNFSEKPIIILGANHSGTRVLVEVLKELGSDPGMADNSWKENILFLNIHKDLIGQVSEKSWDQTIFNLSFIKNFEDNSQYAHFMKQRIDSEIKNYYQNYPFSPWHWKCPTSLLFIRSWLKVYPNAYYIHIFRNPYDVAESLLRRKQFLSLFSALKFSGLMNSKIEDLKIKNYLLIDYDEIEDRLDDLIAFLPFSVKLDGRKSAIGVIKRKPKKIWDYHYSFWNNLWMLAVKTSLFPLRFFSVIPVSNKKR